MTVRRNVKDFRVPRIDDNVIDKQARSIQIHQQSPTTRSVGRRVNLSVERAEVKTIGVVRINNQRSCVSPTRAGNAPITCVWKAAVLRVRAKGELEGCNCG